MFFVTEMVIRLLKSVLLVFGLWMTGILGDQSARATTLEEVLKSRPLAFSSCSIGKADVHLILMLDTDPDRHAVVVMVEGEITAWLRFDFSESGIEWLESSSGIAMADLLSGWGDFLLDKPLKYRVGFSGVKRPFEFACPESENSPW